MTACEFVALWVGIDPGRYGTKDNGILVIRKMDQGRRFSIMGGPNLQVISCNHHIIGYGHIIEQVAVGQAFDDHGNDHEDIRLEVEREFEKLGIFGPVNVHTSRVTPMDGHDVHD